ncbi:MAG: hypothetical protein SWX82_06585 [Cyanobacteriota bacterium]|nr:hypothetical protein [Cyanobacteriota bacterium]
MFLGVSSSPTPLLPYSPTPLLPYSLMHHFSCVGPVGWNGGAQSGSARTGLGAISIRLREKRIPYFKPPYYRIINN